MQKNKVLITSIMFNLFWGITLAAEVYKSDYSLLILISSTLLYAFLHLKFFAEKYVNEVVFMTLALLIGLTAEGIMSNIGIYHFGLVDMPGLQWPPAWIASLWVIFPVYLVNSLKILNRFPITGAYIGAVLTYTTYAIVGERLDLIFFHSPWIKTALFFTLFWYLIIRLLFSLHKKILKYKLI